MRNATVPQAAFQETLRSVPAAVKKVLLTTPRESWWDVVKRWGYDTVDWVWRLLSSLGPVTWLVVALIIAFAFVWYWQTSAKPKRVNVKHPHQLRRAAAALLGAM